MIDSSQAQSSIITSSSHSLGQLQHCGDHLHEVEGSREEGGHDPLGEMTETSYLTSNIAAICQPGWQLGSASVLLNNEGVQLHV